ncbi:MAG: TRAP transporter substrate-binding protein, partial [Lachnospiraceae bacterium]|nr:TRAP transporter substrate-binding protein [Lachnospiraceae bacterium]
MGRKRKIIAFLAVFLALSAGIALCIYRMPKEVEPEFVFSYAENQTENYPTTVAAQFFAELVEKRTNGRIRIIIRAEGELGAENDVITQMQYGGIDFARVSLSQLAGTVPEMSVLQMPYLYVNSRHMWRVLDGEIGNTFLGYVENSDLVGLSWYDAGARNFYSVKKPITCVEDMEGMRIRVQESELMADMVEALGATALPVSYAEVYSSLEQGNCDGAENNWPSYEAMRHYEVAPYFSVDEHNRVPEVQICSLHTWEKLSEEDRQIIKECAEESALYQRALWTQREQEARQLALENGVQEILLTPEEKQRFR